MVDLKVNKLVLLFSLISLLLLVTVAALAYQNWQKQAKKPTTYEECLQAPGSRIQESYPATCVTVAGTSFKQKNLLPPDPTADWETYTNSDIGFSVKYPTEYAYKEITDLGPYDQRVVFENSSQPITYFSISTSIAPNIPEFPNDLPPSGTYTLQGYSGIYQELPQGNPHGSYSPPQVSVIVESPKKPYTIIFLGVADINNDLVSQILSSFQFTNENNASRFCGGIAGIICSEGYECKYEGDYPDAGGTCIKN